MPTPVDVDAGVSEFANTFAAGPANIGFLASNPASQPGLPLAANSGDGEKIWLSFVGFAAPKRSLYQNMEI